MFIQSDSALGDHGGPFPVEMLRHVASTALRGVGVRTIPNEALASAVQQLSAAGDGNFTVPLLNRERFVLFLYILAAVLGMSLTLIGLCCLYNFLGSWRHALRFRRCQEKVARVHE